MFFYWKCDRSSPTILHAKSSLRGDQYLQVYVRFQAFSEGKRLAANLGAGELWKVGVGLLLEQTNLPDHKIKDIEFFALRGWKRTQKEDSVMCMKWWGMFWGQISILYPLAKA